MMRYCSSCGVKLNDCRCYCTPFLNSWASNWGRCVATTEPVPNPVPRKWIGVRVFNTTHHQTGVVIEETKDFIRVKLDKKRFGEKHAWFLKASSQDVTS